MRRKPGQVETRGRGLVRPAVDVLGLNPNFGSLTVRQADPQIAAVTIQSSGDSYAGDLLRLIKASGVVVLEIANNGIIQTTQAIRVLDGSGNVVVALNPEGYETQMDITPPGTPAAGNTRAYSSLKAGVATRYYIDDAGNVYDFSRLAAAPSLVAASITAPVSIANSATETMLVSLSVPANTLVAGTTLAFGASGTAGTTILAPTTTWRVRIGATTLTGNVACSWAPTVGTGLSGAGWHINGELTVRTAGAGGTCLANGVLTDALSTALASAVVLSDQTATVAVDTTATKLAELTFKFGTADPANVLSCDTAWIAVVKP
jgi:hypothetical protein